MKRIITSLLVVVFLLGAVGLVGSATLYSATRNVDNSFFWQDQRGQAPSLEEANVVSPVIYDYDYAGMYGPCTAGTEINLSIGSEEATAYVLVVGNYVFDHEGYQYFETIDAYEYELNEEDMVVVQQACLMSQYAVKTQHSGMISNLNEGTAAGYELTIVTPLYYALYPDEA